MSATVWTGLEEFKQQLRAMPAELTGEASGIVTGEAEGAAAEIRAVYEAHARSGDLASHVFVSAVSKGQFGAGAVVKSTGKHAWLFDNGSQARHRVSGASTGTMWGQTPTPPLHTFVATMIRRRRAMYEQLKALLARKGLVVTGDA